MRSKNYSKILNSDFSVIIKEPLDWNLLKNKKILVTGGTGFIVSYLIKILFLINKNKNLNIKIDCIVRNKKKALKVFSDQNYFDNFLTIKDISILNKIKLKPKYNYIIHAASVASPKVFHNPVEIINPNIIGTIELLKFAENNNLDRFIFFSTTAVSGHVNDKLRPISENIYGSLDPTSIENTYLESKRMAENICFAWLKQKKIPIQIIRPAHTYGPGVNFDDGRIYADFISSLVQNKNIILYSNGKAVRNFCYVADFIIGLFYVILSGKIGEVYNLSSEKEYSIKGLANLLVNKIFKEKKLKIIYKTEENPYIRVNFKKSTCSNKKARLLGWKLKFTIEDGMRRTIKSFE
jgi:nucleoside-diphosphate-sugar epimerase